MKAISQEELDLVEQSRVNMWKVIEPLLDAMDQWERLAYVSRLTEATQPLWRVANLRRADI